MQSELGMLGMCEALPLVPMERKEQREEVNICCRVLSVLRQQSAFVVHSKERGGKRKGDTTKCPFFVSLK